MSFPMTSTSTQPEARRAPTTLPAYVLRMPGETLLAYGQNGSPPAGALDTLADRTERYFSENRGGPDVLVGALPYDPAMSAHLIQPERVLRVQGRHDLASLSGLEGSPSARIGSSGIVVTADPAAEIFGMAVARGLEALAVPGTDLRKIVLSRSLKVSARNAFSVAELLRRLAGDDGVTAFVTPLPSRHKTPRYLVGATPELLLEKRGANVASHPLAGSARRHADEAADRQSADMLLRSDKDRREHAMVVEAIMDLLAPHCRALSTPDGTALKATASMWHLGTRICGKLKDASISSQRLAALLHPTPAVCGMPRNLAHRVIGDLEVYDRDFYAGAVGWCDSAGDGRWFVSIRCAEIEGKQARLYAGAGIVPGSTPEGEVAETAAKFRAMLDAFGIDAACVDGKE
ncbi:isochorismate synthase [Rhizobium sp. CG5]|uniref:isochorismate synthase n=1 Tax=Rhizobium sp. CG5 TaxID=2726076 RepID=UPI002033BA97|nr:isochorismate synthase [Rhizobium sp. CG5]MCM2476484.1 isochorismate synthase [Rhizobium sp. CG5]